MPPVKPRGVRVSGFRVGWKGFARGLKVFGGFNLGFRIVVLGLRLAYKLGVGFCSTACKCRGARPRKAHLVLQP